jgi:hypothetical protein
MMVMNFRFHDTLIYRSCETLLNVQEWQCRNGVSVIIIIIIIIIIITTIITIAFVTVFIVTLITISYSRVYLFLVYLPALAIYGNVWRPVRRD